ncbi:MAG: DUF2062 domain-containing protein [Rhizobacter sp.]|nr:DUF2062 domain-containing protein [Bacteriovorax sp.]
MFKKVAGLVIEELKKGATPEKLSQGLVTGILFGIFPLIGFTTLMSVLAGFIFKLNQIVVQTTNYLMYPVQIIMIPIYIKVVSMIFDVGYVPLRPDILISQFRADPGGFLRQYAIIGVYAVGLWCILSVVLYLVLYPVILKAVLKFKKGRR